MKIKKGNILDYIDIGEIICVTTNGVIKNDGELVMGGGCALAFKQHFPDLPKTLGSKVLIKGNVPIIAGKVGKSYIVSFPTKHHYKDNSSISLIKNSAIEIINIANKIQATSIYIPSPGTGLGRLNKDIVYKELASILDDRFIILELE